MQIAIAKQAVPPVPKLSDFLNLVQEMSKLFVYLSHKYEHYVMKLWLFLLSARNPLIIETKNRIAIKQISIPTYGILTFILNKI